MILRSYFLLIFFGCFFSYIGTQAQNSFYDIDQVREIRINFYQTNWDHILDSLYVKGDEDRMLAAITIDGTRIDSVGIRYKGYSSVSVNRKKNPFNIKLNYTDNNIKYRGIDKIKLSNVIQDPSFVRETLSYEIARKYMPCSGANFANVFINDTLWGLYTNVESVDAQFLNPNYGSKDNTFFKCNPKTLALFGENSNLSASHGTDSNSYKPYYTLESDYGWSDLYQLIDTLNNHKERVSNILNIDRSLWMHAFNYTLINFDSYVGYAQNYYLYRDNNGIFNPIIWDLNMSFGSFRLTDDSDNFGGFSIIGAETIDPLQHFNSISVFARPLMRNLYSNARYRKMYLAHMRTIIDENFTNQLFFQRGMQMQGLIDAYVLADPNKFYSYSAFQANLISPVSDLIDYPGIKTMMDNRTTYLNSYPGFRGEPTIIYTENFPEQINHGDNVSIICKTTDATFAFLSYRLQSGDVFSSLQMFDDGLHNDSLSADGIYGAQIANVGNIVEYYVYAENDTAGVFSPQRAAYEFHSVLVKISPGDLVINEFMAKNQNTVLDPSGDADDWIELFNNSNKDLYTDGLYLSDERSDLQKWAFPETKIQSNGFLIVWADDEVGESGIHCNFKLDADQETLYLSYGEGSIIDSIKFTKQNTDFSTGRYPNGSGAFAVLSPTFNRNNNTAVVLSNNSQSPEIVLFPNPANDVINVATHYRDPFSIEIYSSTGTMIREQTVSDNTGITAVPVYDLSNGLYLLRTKNSIFESTHKFIIQ